MLAARTVNFNLTNNQHICSSWLSVKTSHHYCYKSKTLLFIPRNTNIIANPRVTPPFTTTKAVFCTTTTTTTTTTACKMSSTKPPPPPPVITVHTEQQHIPITIPSHLFLSSPQNDQHSSPHRLKSRSLTYPWLSTLTRTLSLQKSSKTPSSPQHDLPPPRSHPLLTHPAFQSWLNTLTHSLALQKTSKNHPFHADPYELKSVKVNHINYFGRGEKARIGFVSMDAEIKNSAGESLPGVVFLRGGAVAVLVIVEEDEGEGESEGEGEGDREQWTILTSQPRIPVGALRFLEIPAGMIDSAGKVAGKAAEEIKEELGITIDADKLIDLCALTEQMGRGTEGQGDAGTGMAEEEKVEVGMYPSAGGSDEFIRLYAYIHRVGKGGIKELEGKVGGVREDGERIVLRVVKLKDMWRVAGRDAKALGAWALWTGLKEAKVL